MSSRNIFHVESFINSFGQEIKPNDKVMFVAESWKTVRLNKGTYRGVWKNEKGEVQSVPLTYWYNRNEDKFRVATLPRKRIFKLELWNPNNG